MNHFLIPVYPEVITQFIFLHGIFLLRLKIHPPHATKDGRNYWRHDLFPQMLCEDKFINPDQMDEWEWLYYLRIRADYYEEKIEKADADESIRLAYQLIVHFQNEELRADD